MRTSISKPISVVYLILFLILTSCGIVSSNNSLTYPPKPDFAENCLSSKLNPNSQGPHQINNLCGYPITLSYCINAVGDPKSCDETLTEFALEANETSKVFVNYKKTQGYSFLYFSCKYPQIPVKKSAIEYTCKPLPVPSTPNNTLFELSSSQVKPFDTLKIVVRTPIVNAQYELWIDIGSIVVHWRASSATKFEYVVPVGIFNDFMKPSSGAMRVTLWQTLNGQQTKATADVNVTLPTYTGPPGKAAMALLRANQMLVANSLAPLQFASSKLKTPLDLTAITSAVELFRQSQEYLERNIALVAQQGVVNIEVSPGVTLELTPAVVQQMDLYAVALTEAMQSSQAQTLASSAAGNIDWNADVETLGSTLVKNLTGNFTNDVRKSAKTVTQVAGLTIAVAGLVAGGSAAVPLAVLGAMAFVIPTAVGSAIGLAIDAGSAAMLNGRARLESFAPTGKFIADQTFDYAIGEALSAGTSKLFGGALGGAIKTAADAIGVYEGIVKDKISQAYTGGELDTNGYQEPNYSIILTPNSPSGSSYSVYISSSAAAIGQTVQVQVSRNGSHFSSYTVLIGANPASIEIPVPSPSQYNITDSIIAYVKNSRALQSVQVNFLGALNLPRVPNSPTSTSNPPLQPPSGDPNYDDGCHRSYRSWSDFRSTQSFSDDAKGQVRTQSGGGFVC